MQVCLARVGKNGRVSRDTRALTLHEVSVNFEQTLRKITFFQCLEDSLN